MPHVVKHWNAWQVEQQVFETVFVDIGKARIVFAVSSLHRIIEVYCILLVRNRPIIYTFYCYSILLHKWEQHKSAEGNNYNAVWTPS